MKVKMHEEVNEADERFGSESKTWALQIPCGEVTLSGDLEIPANAVGLVLFAHGSGSSRFSRRNRAVAGVLRASGVGTLLFDLLTEEEETVDAYTRHLRFDIGLLTRRLVTVTEEMADDARGRGFGLGYFGSSTGGAGSSGTCTENQSGRFPRRSTGSRWRRVALREGSDAVDRGRTR
jgi:putative phosphoribosyl transferase